MKKGATGVCGVLVVAAVDKDRPYLERLPCLLSKVSRLVS
jgi:hypothetical protein